MYTERMKKITLALIACFAVLGLAGYMLRDSIYVTFFRPTDSTLPTGVEESSLSDQSIETIETKLAIPWGIVELPDGDLLISERPGTIHRLSDGKKFSVSGTVETGESGLLGIVLHPEFTQNKTLYAYITTQADNGLVNRIDRFTYNDESIDFETTILANIPGAKYHDGGRMAFGPDGLLYVTTGDALQPGLAQDVDSLAGKILRLQDDGTTPQNNPFNSLVYSYGHRNPQGLAWDDAGQLWSTEHGPSGVDSGYDELNLIVKGGNYGWPVVQGDETGESYIPPVVQSGSDETWAPAGLTYNDGSLFFGGLRGESLYEAKINEDNTVTLLAHFREDYGRLRSTAMLSDGTLLVSTSNTDGRGKVREGDDRLIKIDMSVFE